MQLLLLVWKRKKLTACPRVWNCDTWKITPNFIVKLFASSVHTSFLKPESVFFPRCAARRRCWSKKRSRVSSHCALGVDFGGILSRTVWIITNGLQRVANGLCLATSLVFWFYALAGSSGDWSVSQYEVFSATSLRRLVVGPTVIKNRDSLKECWQRVRRDIRAESG